MQQDQVSTPGCVILVQLPECHHTYTSKGSPRLWIALPPIDMNQSLSTIKNKLTRYLYNHFINTLILYPVTHALSITYVHVQVAQTNHRSPYLLHAFNLILLIFYY